MSDPNLALHPDAPEAAPAATAETSAEPEERFPFATDDLLLWFAFLWLPREEKC